MAFFCVRDRENRELLSAEPYAEINWATHVNMGTGQPIEREGARYEDGEERISPTPTGEELWSYDLGLGISAPPVTYSVGDKQYLAVLVGYGCGTTHRNATVRGH